VARPYVYTVTATVLEPGGKQGDSVNVTVGVRTLQWKADSGFYLNGQHTKIRGFCDQ
jgi:beta-galactosidase